MSAEPLSVIPAKAGIQFRPLGSRFRGNDEYLLGINTNSDKDTRP